MADKKVVISIFENEQAADRAVESLKNMRVAENNAIGVLVLDKKGKVKSHKVGSHSFFKGAGIGVVLALLGPIGIGVGALGGGLLGLLHHKGLGLSDADRERITAELANGKAAVGVLASVDDAHSIEEMLTGLGGVSETHTVTDEALEEMGAAAGAPPADS